MVNLCWYYYRYCYYYPSAPQDSYQRRPKNKLYGFLDSNCADKWHYGIIVLFAACSSYPCESGGTCHLSGGTYYCECPDGTSGDSCDIPSGEALSNIVFYTVSLQQIQCSNTLTHSWIFIIVGALACVDHRITAHHSLWSMLYTYI